MYTFIDKIKRLSNPTSTRGYVEGPYVYFQLGNQFAGKGHVVSSVEFEKPYRDGRYILANCSMTFTFHEEFETDFDLLKDDTDYSQYISPYIYSEDLGPLEYFEDFVRITYDPDYFIEQVFGDQKVERFVNIMEDALTERWAYPLVDYGPEDARSDFEAIISDDFATSYDEQGQMISYNNPFVLDLFRIMSNVKRILNPIFTMTTIYDNLKLSSDLLNKVYVSFVNSYVPENLKGDLAYEFGYTTEQLNLIGWYPSDIRDVWYLMRIAEKELFKELYFYFSSVVYALIRFYEGTTSPGD